MTFVKPCQRDLWTERWNIDNLQFPYSQVGCFSAFLVFKSYFIKIILCVPKKTPAVIWFCYICQILYWDLDLRSRPDLRDVFLPFLVFFLVSLHRQYEQIYVYTKLLWGSTASLQTKWIIEHWLKSITQRSDRCYHSSARMSDSWNLRNIKFLDDQEILSKPFLEITLNSKSVLYLLTFTLFCKYSSTFPCQQREGCPIHWSYCASYCLSYRVSYPLVSALFLTFILIPANSFGKQPWLDILSLFVGDL